MIDLYSLGIDLDIIGDIGKFNCKKAVERIMELEVSNDVRDKMIIDEINRKKELRKEWSRKSNKDWRERNIEKIREYARNWREKNRDKVNMNAKRWRDNNKDKMKESAKRWRLKNKDKVNKYHKIWRDRNPDKVKESNKRKQMRIENDPN